jgi:DNA-directed RNA polymerase subunit omega
MDPLVVFDCQEQVPNRFALALAAAARSRALGRGKPPRIGASNLNSTELALQEIAAGAFARQELELFLPSKPASLLLAGPTELRGSELLNKDAAAPASHSRDTVH